jgi:oligoendopeptidase F
MSSYADANAFYRALVAKWTEICKAAGMDDYAEDPDAIEGLSTVLLNYQGYYISYATSAVAALEVYAYACEDWDAAVEAYKFLYSAHDATDTFTSVLEKAGLKSIFDEDAFKMIADAIGYDYQAAASSEE